MILLFLGVFFGILALGVILDRAARTPRAGAGSRGAPGAAGAGSRRGSRRARRPEGQAAPTFAMKRRSTRASRGPAWAPASSTSWCVIGCPL